MDITVVCSCGDGSHPIRVYSGFAPAPALFFEDVMSSFPLSTLPLTRQMQFVGNAPLQDDVVFGERL